MPFEARAGKPRRIAVIGAGISGMGAAHMLADDNHVTLFEAEPRLGGHARTKIAGKRGDQPVDTGFIVFNYANYPHMAQLFERLDVPVVKSDMSFAASLRGGDLEYGLRSLSALFAQKRNAVNPRFLGMVRDIAKFNARALEESRDRSLSLGDFLANLGTGDWFRDYYLLPLSGAIWSTPVEQMLDFPAHAMIQFFENHALLHHTGQHQWYTVDGGSVEYVRRLGDEMVRQGVQLRLGTPIDAVRRVVAGAEVKAQGGEWESFDEVVFATHSDDSLRLLSDATPMEQRALGAVKYQPNRVVLHADESIMPKRRVTWSSWNYTEDKVKAMNTIDLTYWMNCLQPIPMDDPMFVTLNSARTIREELIYDETVLRHPVYDLAALEAQQVVAAMNGTGNTWFCGAWMKNGFHEDGLSSAVDVVTAIRAQNAVATAA
ncbi:NAD(P)/FAD-dependent oxidoreductase [Aestuariicoccus sp. MJ-SS9]|uniref:NAD(P)/FAD-dependent oxidoreductase n=1 Tax=Aestuariicoccus sp. MJ-SS9 TaxID=3079855 RepID=UPI002914BFF2|nr:FAD-dependent oxidoreductase [Aestuariicoccus sp. MJ-SS9]MDU8910687.1 FAD-dependent oxidoreductase [Aestuariicoccus sp. MJ-SS9]